MKKKLAILVFAAVIAVSCASKQTKFQELSERVEKFNKAVYWGMLPRAMAFVNAESQDVLKQDLRRRIRNEKTVDMQIEEVDIKDEGDLAEVSVVTRYYQSPSYTVMERREEQVWTYETLGDGWTLTANRPLTEGVPSALPDPSGAMR